MVVHIMLHIGSASKNMGVVLIEKILSNPAQFIDEVPRMMVNVFPQEYHLARSAAGETEQIYNRFRVITNKYRRKDEGS